MGTILVFRLTRLRLAFIGEEESEIQFLQIISFVFPQKLLRDDTHDILFVVH